MRRGCKQGGQAGVYARMRIAIKTITVVTT